MSLPLPSFKKLRVLIVGDVMLDQYWSGNTSRISPEAPVPVVHVKNQEERVGGAGNVALNVLALGAESHLMGICGQDDAGEFLEGLLKTAGVTCTFLKTPSTPTISKLRILSHHQQLLRIDFEEPCLEADFPWFIKQYTAILPTVDVIIFSDYAKGCLQHVEQMIELARAAQKPTFVDPKGKNFERYRYATVITPNLTEFEEVVGSCRDEKELVKKGIALLNSLALEALVITRGEDGITLIQHGKDPQHLKAHAREVYDVTGAGDTVISVLTLSYIQEKNWEKAVMRANVAAGISIGKLGAMPVSWEELRVALNSQIEPAKFKGIVNQTQLKDLLQAAKARGERVVMTGGCFDILHAGHVAYLNEAKSFGDLLIVAINEDEMVTQLKGKGRPINRLNARMEVVAGLRSVDWVVSFAQNTPISLIEQVQPDVWVKGGDYQVKDLPEAKIILAQGGEIKIVNYRENSSTTRVIEKIKKQSTE